MNCPHCNIPIYQEQPFSVAVEGGRAYARLCVGCGHVLSIRARQESDPAQVPDGLSPRQLARLQFVRWRLTSEVNEQVKPNTSAA